MSDRDTDQQLTTADIARGSTATKPREAVTPMPAPAPADASSTDRTEFRTDTPDADRSPRPPATGESRTLGTEHSDRHNGSTHEPATSEETSTPLFASNDAESFKQRWTDVQAGFVDDPRRAVESADGLVADVIKNLAEAFANERSGLENQWQQGADVSTEELRLALRRYRSFFDRLLAV